MAVAAPSPTPVEEDFKSAYADLQPPAEDFKSAYADLAAPPEEDFKAAYADLSPDAAVPETAKALGETANEWSKGAGLPALVNPDFAVMPEGAVPTTERDLLKPYVEIPSVPQQEGTLAQIGAGAVNVPVGFANFMLSPAGMMTAATGGAGLIPKAAQTLAGAGFTAQQIKDFFNAQTLQERITTGVGAALLGVATVFGAKTKTPTGEPNATTQGEIKPIAATPRTETQVAPATETAGAGDVVPFDNPWLRRKNKTQESSPAAAASATPLQDAWEKYDGTGEIQTVPDLVDHVENLIAEGKAPESLQGAVDAYREAAHEDFTEFAGRGNADAYERAFTDAVQGAEVFQPKPSQVEAFHGSPSGTITKFSKKHQAAEGGYFFATQPDIAQVYAGKDGGVTPVSLTVKNPLVMTADQWSSPEWTSPSEAKKLGYDSIKIVAHDPAFEGKPASDTWIVFDSKQIKPSPPAATGATAQNLFIKIGDKTYPVDSLKDASDKFSTARTKTFEQGVGSEALPLNPTIVDSKGNPVGRISQNGNIWDAKNPKELIHNATGLVKRADGTWGLPEKQAKPTPSAPNPTLPEKPVQSKPVDTADSVEKPVDAKAPAETGAKAEAAAPPEPPAAAEVPPEQPQKPSKIGQSIEAKAVEAKLTKGFAETAGYDPITIRDQAQRATDLIKSSLPDARNIIRGEAVLPDGLRGTSLITAMEEHLLQHPDAQMAYELANSPLTSATSAAAQEMRLMAERVPDGITAKFSEIREARKAGAKQRGETPQRVAKEVTKEIVKNSSKRPTWDAFVREITC